MYLPYAIQSGPVCSGQGVSELVCLQPLAHAKSRCDKGELLTLPCDPLPRALSGGREKANWRGVCTDSDRSALRTVRVTPRRKRAMSAWARGGCPP